MNSLGNNFTLRKTLSHTVHAIRHITSDSFILRFSKNDLQFTPGQHISVGPQYDTNMREYSIYSSPGQDFLEILVKEIPQGSVTPKLKKMKAGESIKVEGPFGFFTINEIELKRPLYFIATGTGIAPFHCFALSYKNTLAYKVLHGIRTTDERYEHTTFPPEKYIPCISKPHNAIDFPYYAGRVTNYLKDISIDTEGVYFLCGNCDMIYEVFDILQSSGVSSEQIKAEVYF